MACPAIVVEKVTTEYVTCKANQQNRTIRNHYALECNYRKSATTGRLRASPMVVTNQQLLVFQKSRTLFSFVLDIICDASSPIWF